MDGVKKATRMMVLGGVDVLAGLNAQKKLAEDGVSTTAVCRSFEINWEREDGQADPRWGASTMTLEVTPPGGGAAYEWSGEMWVRVAYAKQVESELGLEGHEMPVRVDAGDPQKVAVDWDAINEAPAKLDWPA